MKTSLDLRGNQGSNENDIPLHLKKRTFTFEVFEKNPYMCIYRTDFLAKFRENPKPRSPYPI